MEHLKFIIPYLFVTALSGNTMAETGYDYISGGFQYSSISSNSTDSPVDSLSGYYLGGSWNFYDQFFSEIRHEKLSKNSIELSESMIGLGYYYPVYNDLSAYIILGGVDYRLTYELTDNIIPDGILNEIGSTNLGITTNNSALAVELGVKWNVLDNLTIEPAVRMLNYDEVIIDYRLDTVFEIYDGISIEANIGYQSMDLVKTFVDNSKLDLSLDTDELYYQLGFRYSF
ncbi:hypothetical protein L4D09_23240 [Photobacterium makurazakiensis]|uniref:hypothetical protein n=1 Tax=Photobacterium makurazakiensis TaxID=2910234 RepID=UPI003D0DC697